MMRNLNACSKTERLQNVTLLAMLPSNPDFSQAIVRETGEVVDLAGIAKNVVQRNINTKVWVYYEQAVPRKLLLLNPNWAINSFDPKTRNVCVTIFTGSGNRVLNFTLQPLTPA